MAKRGLELGSPLAPEPGLLITSPTRSEQRLLSLLVWELLPSGRLEVPLCGSTCVDVLVSLSKASSLYSTHCFLRGISL